MRRPVPGWIGPFVWGFALPAAAAAFAPGEGGRAGFKSVTVATYNVENYAPADRMTADGYRRGYPKPEGEKRAVREAIEAMGADVLALQEMGPAPYLAELRHDLAAEGLDYPYSALVEAADSVRHVALLSRLPFKSVVRHAELAFPYRGGTERVKRGLLEAVVPVPPGDLSVFVVHLKSRLGGPPGDPDSQSRRLAEATAIRDCIRMRFPDPAAARFVVIGDFNDGRNSPALRRLRSFGGRASACLAAADSRGETWTEEYRRGGSYADFDHIVVSPALRPSVEGGVARIYDGPGAAGGSDHRPVLATLIFRTP